MPIYEISCQDCCQVNEVIMMGGDNHIECPSCGSMHTQKLMSATSSLTGRNGQSLPGAGDTTCCDNSPKAAGCAGPGSCCGKLG